MTKRNFKAKIYGEMARVTKALANPHRLEIIELLAQAEYAVEDIAAQTGLPMANASQHLQVLKAAQLATAHRKGNFIHYRLADTNVFKTWKALRELGIDRISAINKVVKEFRKSNAKIESVTINQLVERLDSGTVTVVDVRPEAEFNKGHIAGAISIPVDQLKKRLNDLRSNTPIVAYCRGPFCVYADEAVVILNKVGYNAARLDEGFPDWQLAGLPIETSLN
jgi:rhodanese-related sulfurtransferase/DNA-binding transcriptional ArsR family regulator